MGSRGCEDGFGSVGPTQPERVELGAQAAPKALVSFRGWQDGACPPLTPLQEHARRRLRQLPLGFGVA